MMVTIMIIDYQKKKVDTYDFWIKEFNKNTGFIEKLVSFYQYYKI